MEDKEYKVIGNYIPPDEDGNGEVIERSYFRQGMIFKNPYAFYNEPTQVCYIPETSDTTYTREDFLNMALGDELIAEMIFEAVDWQHPETYLEEQFVMGELDVCKECGKIYESYEVAKCPHCNAERLEVQNV